MMKKRSMGTKRKNDIKERKKKGQGGKRRAACVFTRRVCNAKPDSSSFSERHNYAVIAPSLFEDGICGYAHVKL